MNQTIFNTEREAIYDYLIDHCNVPADYLEHLNDLTVSQAYKEASHVAELTGEQGILDEYLTRVY